MFWGQDVSQFSAQTTAKTYSAGPKTQCFSSNLNTFLGRVRKIAKRGYQLRPWAGNNSAPHWADFWETCCLSIF